MNKIFFIILVFIICSCGQNSSKTHNDFNEVYIAKVDFGEVSNKIRLSTLDSLINSLSAYRLNDYKTIGSVENTAFMILKERLAKKEINVNGFLITESKILNDSILVFTVSHIDYYTYKYNRTKMNPEQPPITGNISGYEGLYYVDIKSKTLNIIYVQ
jgi:hypothetical protein